MPCLLVALLMGVVLSFYTPEDDGLAPVTLPVLPVVDVRSPDPGVPFVHEPTERTGALSIARRELERGPPPRV